MSRFRAVLGITCLGAVALATPATAGLFDFLFGDAPAPSYPPSYGGGYGPGYGPLGVRVRPRKSRPTVERAERRDRSERRKVVRTESRPEKGDRHVTGRQASMDPRTQPDWYLHDPNLRRGDIVILADGPVVYSGASRTRSREDFVSLKESGSVSQTGQREIDMMVTGVWTPPAEKPPGRHRRSGGREAAAE